jgi:hypothetical protein
VQNWFHLFAWRAGKLQLCNTQRTAALALIDGASGMMTRNGGGIVAETLLGVAAVELTVGLDALLALAADYAPPLRFLVVDSIIANARVRSPLDAAVLISADEFFALVEAHGIYSSSRSDAVLPTGVASSVRYKGIKLEPTAADATTRNKQRVAFLRRIINAFLGSNVVRPKNNTITSLPLRKRLWLVRSKLAASLLPPNMIDDAARTLLDSVDDVWKVGCD